MSNSLRAKISKLRYKGEITQEEYAELIKKLDGHDSELLDEVAERIDKALTDDDSIYKEISSEWNKGTFMGCVLSVIAELKAEVEK